MKNIRGGEKREPALWEALVTLGFLVAMLAVGIMKYHTDPHVPMLLGTMGAALMALRLGYKWKEIEKSMLDGISKALQSVVILMIIGVLIGVWVDTGVVPTMIYYGLMILKPSYFFVASMLICSITSLATGTSWGTMGTMGVALMGIGLGLGMEPGMTAGAIISGAYFGDKMSPLSDTTNLAPAMAGTDVMSHVRFMILPTSITYGVCLVIFGILGFTQYHGASVDLSAVDEIQKALSGLFTINPVLLLPPVIVIVAVARKMPAIPGITLGILSGGILGLLLQSKCTLGSLFSAGMSGYVAKTGMAEIDSLLQSGGIKNMMFSVSMTIIAMMFGGIMEDTHQFQAIVARLKVFARRPASLVTTTIFTCLLSNILMPEQYISIVVPGRMFSEEYRRQGLSPTTLSNALESSGTVTSALVPWNTCGTFILTTLGVSTMAYGRWAIFNWLMPIVCILLAFAGVTVANTDGVRFCKLKKARSEEGRAADEEEA